MTKNVTLIVLATVNPEETDSFHAYLEGLTACYQKVHVKPTYHYTIKNTYMGDQQQPDFLSIIPFDSMETFKAVYDSAEYQQLIPFRDKGFKRLEVYFADI